MFISAKPRKDMKWYSRSKEDFRYLIYNKYKMSKKELTYVFWPDCSKCRQLRPHVEKWCSENWYNFVPMQYWEDLLDITSIPTAILDKEDGKEMLDFEGIVQLLSSKK